VSNRIERNKRFLTDLFAGPFPGHAIIMEPEPGDPPGPGDVITSDLPIDRWVDYCLREYEKRLRYHEKTGDDSVPYVKGITGTEMFAAAFGCPVHVYEDVGMPPSARPMVYTAEQADRVAEPGLDHPVFRKWFDFAERLARNAGPGVPVSVPDIQSAFDIAALIWNKEDFFLAMIDSPDAVKHLVGKCHRVLVAFVKEFLGRFEAANLCHCPTAWAPPELGMWLSEDEAGSMSAEAFREFCLPSLVQLSETFGGLFVHCCAAADHQYENFRAIPELRGLNRVFQEPGPRPAIEAFAGETVLIQAWLDEAAAIEMLDMARPNSRFLFNIAALPLDEAVATCDRLLASCERR